jgi:hypothetical protein
MNRFKSYKYLVILTSVLFVSPFVCSQAGHSTHESCENKGMTVWDGVNAASLTAPTLTVVTSGTSVTLSWNAVSGATGYTLFYAPHPYTGPETIGNVDMGTQAGISANLWESAAFYVAVQAYNSAGSSRYSNIEHFIIDSSGWSKIIPDTTDGVYIWADQLQTYNDNQNEFVARHFVGSQKLTKDRIDAIRNYNSDFIVLQYHKAYGVDIGNNIVGPYKWGSDIATMNQFVANNPEYGDLEDYYIHWTNKNDSDHRVQHYWAGNLEYHLSDIRHAGFRAYLIDETTKRCEEVGFDGTFFDVSYFPWYEYEPDYDTSVGFGGSGIMWYEYAPWNWPSINQDPSTLAQNWNSLVIPYWQEITRGYHSGETMYYSIVNCDRMVTGWYEHVYLDYVDGAMPEGWMTGGDENSRLTGNDWELSASRILRYITGNDKILIAQPTNGWSSNIALREWWIANYFLLKNDKSFYFYAYSMDVYWWPEYEIDIGAFMQSPTKNLNDLLVEGTQSLYARSYEKGLVLVNPGESSQQYTLEGTYYRYSFTGGGYVATNTKPAMTIEHSTPMTGAVSIEPNTALILRNQS